MKLKTLELTHFRCFEHLRLDLHEDVTVLVGANASGKTAILDGIAIALSELIPLIAGPYAKSTRGALLKLVPTDVHLAPKKGPESKSEEQEPAGEEGIPNSGEDEAEIVPKGFVHFRAVANQHYHFANNPLVTDEGKPRDLEWSDHVIFSPSTGFRSASDKTQGLPELRGYFNSVWKEIANSSASTMIELPVVAYYQAGRRLAEMPPLGNVLSVKQSRGDAFARAMDAGANFQAMCQWYYLRENDEIRKRVPPHGDPNFKHKDLAAARRAIAALLPGIRRVFFEGTPPKMMTEFGQEGQKPKPLQLTQLSDGYRTMLAITLDFARRLSSAHPNWPDPLQAPGIMLIDEIELHLHPRWQHQLIPALRRVFPNTQLIVTTHSPQILSTVRRESIQVLSIDHKLEPLPGDVGTYGAENSQVIADVLGVYPRPQGNPIVEALAHYWELVEDGNAETEEGLALRKQLDDALGRHDPDLSFADVRISQIKELKGDA